MKKLILIRHSDAETGSFSSSDFGRTLTQSGKSKAHMQANRLAKLKTIPDLFITSTAIRALETTQILSAVLNSNCLIQQVPFLYEEFTTAIFFDLIVDIDNSNETVILVGHNPTISLMASRLDLKAKISFAPCSIGIFEFGDKWDSVEVGGGRLIEFIK